VDKNLNGFLEEISAHEAEIGTDFKKNITAAEERELEQLSNLSQQLQRQWNDLSNQRRELERTKQLLEGDLRQNLQLKLDQLNSQAFENSASGGAAGGMKEAQRELKKAQKSLHTVEANLQETEGKMEQLAGRIDQLGGEKSEREQRQNDISARIEKQQKRMEKTLQRKALLTTQAAECAKNIRELGVLPEEAFDKYENMEANTVSVTCVAMHCGPRLHNADKMRVDYQQTETGQRSPEEVQTCE
jgi:structural maintenance of chromosome 3 (chondroitin sulfate proteoglycan 6)